MLTSSVGGWRWAGFAWTFAWFSFSMRYAAANQFESGPLSEFKPLKFSVLQTVAKMVSRK
jgi:hypothetical protein